MRSQIIALVAAACGAASASAEIRVWEWNRGDAPVSDDGGTFESVRSTYNTINGLLTWEATFSNQVTQGFTLAINDGPNPKGIAGELALVYFDGRNTASPTISIYGYNGENTQTSYRDGSPAGGTQAPDRIMTTLVAGGPRYSPGIIANPVVDAGGKRTLSFSIDTTDLNNHMPLYPSMPNEWTGMQYGDEIGVWFHPVRNLSASYSDGFLSNWGGTQGWLDGEHFTTTPAPGATGLLAMGGLVATRRRRR
ncbi:MAG: hypothetical protein RBS39_12755 [Phycisphaerales bacterium]|jgi:MYXO-CTERM domain-containing protein|nr:hypothetical protein [Phycisphaerales bacterium]